MATQGIPVPDVGALPQDPDACMKQLISLCSVSPELARSFAEETARQAGLRHCLHGNVIPLPLPSLKPEQRRQAALAHDGLCGVHYAAIIAGVSVLAVMDRGNQPNGNKLRGQVCSPRNYTALW